MLCAQLVCVALHSNHTILETNFVHSSNDLHMDILMFESSKDRTLRLLVFAHPIFHKSLLRNGSRV
jgi:hypothetical protein